MSGRLGLVVYDMVVMGRTASVFLLDTSKSTQVELFLWFSEVDKYNFKINLEYYYTYIPWGDIH